MTQQALGSKRQDHPWAWLVHLSAYDRSPTLTSTEQGELDRLSTRFQQGYRLHPRQYQNLLPRLLQPLHDALDVTGPCLTTRTSVIKLLIEQMQQRCTSYWSWTSQEWTEILGSDYEAFRRRYPKPADRRQHLIAVSYLLCGFTDFPALGPIKSSALAVKIFGQEAIHSAWEQVCQGLAKNGYGQAKFGDILFQTLCEVLLTNRSPYLEGLSTKLLSDLRQAHPAYRNRDFFHLSRVLASLGYIPHPLAPAVREGERFGNPDACMHIAPSWVDWCQRWCNRSPLALVTRQGTYYRLLTAGRWLALVHPEIVSPEQWTRELASEYVAAVDRLQVGQWLQEEQRAKKCPRTVGKPVAATTKASLLGALRVFFRDCQEWNWLPRRFHPQQVFATPRAILALIGPNPKVIADASWAKLLWAGLNLTVDDLPEVGMGKGNSAAHKRVWYPLEMVRAMTMVWLFAGLRSDEWSRLRIGCVRWQREDVALPGTDEQLAKDAVCLLDVPTNKTGTMFTKPVDPIVGRAIEEWERARPPQSTAIDAKTGEIVHFLFCYRGYRVSKVYINKVMIPLLCRKSGVDISDARGTITSHRARFTIASQLFNAKDPMSLFELQEWLGHKDIQSTRHYARITPTRLAKAYVDAGYFERNVRSIEVLIDQDAVKSGTAANGTPWEFYDLGHGYCTYEFFEQCPHRMACAKCAFYIPKGTTQAQLLEGKTNLQRMLQEIPLREEERAAIEDGIEAMEKLCQQLADVPTPAGPTPNQLAIESQMQQIVIPVEGVRRRKQNK
jgi:integrase